MKKQIFLLVASSILVFSCKQSSDEMTTAAPTEKLDEKAELEAIWAVIDNETKCFFAGDYECWASNWSHESYALQAWNNDDGTADAAEGWETINEQGKGWIEKYYKNGEIVIHPDFKRATPTVKFFNNNVAYLNWNQYNADSEKKYYRISNESRIMEKEESGWKIVNVSAFWDTGAKVSADSLSMVLNL